MANGNVWCATDLEIVVELGFGEGLDTVILGLDADLLEYRR
jgi:hypothetical protein